VSWHVKKRDRIGLSGPNGAGKTTLLQDAGGLAGAGLGPIRMASDTTIGYLPQDGIVHHGRTVYDEVVLAFQELLALKAEQHEIEDGSRTRPRTATAREAARALRRGHRALQAARRLRDRRARRRRAEGPRASRSRTSSGKTEEFSGGWQMRIALAKLLLARPEPAADGRAHEPPRPARAQLARGVPARLPGLGGARLARPLLPRRDREAHHRGGPAHAHRLPRQLLEVRGRAHGAHGAPARGAPRQSEEIEKAEAFINRFRYQATKARQVQSRIKQLDKVERIEIPPARKKIRFKFPTRPSPGRVVLELKGVRKATARTSCCDSSTSWSSAATASRSWARTAPASRRSCACWPASTARTACSARGHQVVLDYFAQDQAAVLNPRARCYEEMSPASSLTMVPMIRTSWAASCSRATTSTRRWRCCPAASATGWPSPRCC
jgi:ATP-binding cassette subfamily F protein 3